MEKEKIINLSKEFVKSKLEGEGSGHDWWHIVRVLNSALDISKDEVGADSFVVELGTLFHDIADHKFGYSDKDRENIISDFLRVLNVDQDIISHVVYIANHISFNGGKNKHKMTTLEGQIVQDADRLDAIGAIGIARTFAYGGHANRPMCNPTSDSLDLDSIKNNIGPDTISHFYEKLLLLKDKMNTRTGKEKALKRHEFMEVFLDNFYLEWNGDI